MTTKMAKAGSIKVGKFLMMDNEPCKVVSIETAKTGKHGHAKARIVGIGIFDGVKRNLVSPTHSDVEVPIIDRRAGQILAFMGDDVQIMDLNSYETFEIKKPAPDEIEGTMVEGAEVEYIEALGRKKITRVR
jgi:translation initiation factor 5A